MGFGPAGEALSGRTVLVTGASSGIGRACAVRFAERGARVFGTSRHPCPDSDPDRSGVRLLRLDVRDAESVQHCVDEVIARTGGIDVLVNNAGVLQEGCAEETDPAHAAAVLDTNFFGAVRLTDAVLPGMRARRRGRIINIGSLAAWVGEPGEAFYAASKAALARYTEALRHEVWHLGITVCLVEPGVFRTGVLHAGSTTVATIDDYDGLRESAQRTLRRALARGADPRDAAAVIERAATARSPHARYGAGPGSNVIPRLKTLLPQQLVDRLLRHAYHLPR